MSLLFNDVGSPDLVDIYSPYYNPDTGKMVASVTQAGNIPIGFLLVGIILILYFTGVFKS